MIRKVECCDADTTFVNAVRENFMVQLATRANKAISRGEITKVTRHAVMSRHEHNTGLKVNVKIHCTS